MSRSKKNKKAKKGDMKTSINDGGKAHVDLSRPAWFPYLDNLELNDVTRVAEDIYNDLMNLQELSKKLLDYMEVFEEEENERHKVAEMEIKRQGVMRSWEGAGDSFNLKEFKSQRK